MTLFIILLALLIELYAGVPDDVRKLDWFPRYAQALRNRCSRYPFWEGPGGVLITLAGPMLLIAILVWVLLKVFYPMAIVISLICLLYALGAGRLHVQLDGYVQALEAGDLPRIQQLAAELSMAGQDSSQSEREFLEGILLHAHDRLFGVLFWFMVLGPGGAILYRLSAVLLQATQETSDAYAEAARNLHNILNWPVARLFALGNALTGNMVDAMEAWREAEQRSFAVNEQVIRASGMGALNYQQPDDKDELLLEDRIYWIRSLQGMLNRTLLVWLTVLGLITLSGWLG